MAKMKNQGGVAPPEDEAKKLEEFVTWLEENGYNGILLVHKGDVGVSWVNEGDAEEIRHTLLNSLGHIFDENESVAVEFAKGIGLAAGQLFVRVATKEPK